MLNIPNSYLEEESKLSSVTRNIQILCKNSYIDGRWFKYDDRNERERFLQVLVDYDTCMAKPEKRAPPLNDTIKALKILDEFQQEFVHEGFTGFANEQLKKKISKIDNARKGIDRMLSEYLFAQELECSLLAYKELCNQYVTALEKQIHSQ